MKTITDHLRDRLLGPAAFKIKKVADLPDLRGVLVKEFITRMLNRMVMGMFRYGYVRRYRQKDFDRVRSCMDRLHAYQKTGNTENLIDVANLCMVEFYKSHHPSACFKPTDDGVHVRLDAHRENP